MKKITNFICLSWCLLIVGTQAMATSFSPVTIQEKIANSDAVVFGTVRGHGNYKELSKGPIRVATEVSLEVKKSVGLTFDQMLSKDDFKVSYPGGQWGGPQKVSSALENAQEGRERLFIQQIPGAPTFKEGEDVVVLLRSSSNGHWIHHLGAGKFTRINQDGEDILVSQVYSNIPDVGRISFSKFEELLQESHFQKRLSFIPGKEKTTVAQNGPNKQQSERVLASSLKKKTSHGEERDISSISQTKRANNFQLIFLIIVLAIVSCTLIIRIRRKK